MRFHVPALTIIGDDAHRLLVVERDHSRHRWPPVGMECDPFSNSELEHDLVRVNLSQEPQPRHDSVIEIDQFGFHHHVYIDRHRTLSLF
jgi:hypothetical protein